MRGSVWSARRILPLLALAVLVVMAVTVPARPANTQGASANISAFQAANPGLDYFIIADITSSDTTTLYARTSALVTATLTNMDSTSTTVYFRYRTPRDSGAWSDGGSDTTTTTSAAVTLSTLTSGAEYRVQASLDTGFTSTVQADFTTGRPSVSGVSVGSRTRTSAVATLTIANSDGRSATFHVRYRTPRTRGAWTEASVSTAGSSVTYAMTGLTTAADYRVKASHDDTFSIGIDRACGLHDFSEQPARFPIEHGHAEIDENRPEGTDVGDPVTATDADGDTLAYTLSGANASDFAIDSTTGQITVGTGTVLDDEITESYSVTVTATDTYTATGSVVVTIEVQDLREAGVLGRIVISVGRSGTYYGYNSGSYGTLDSGEFPGALFQDGNARSVADIYEDGNGKWYFTYSGGVADDWIDDQVQLDEIVIEVEYDDGRDVRSFVLGGFIADRPGTRELQLAPPLLTRDWDDKDGQEVAIEFRRHVTQLPTNTRPAPLDEPTARQGSFIAFLNETTPGGPIVGQALIVIMVFMGYIFTAPPTPWGMILGAIVLVMTAWVPVFFGYGSTMAASIILVNVVTGGYAWKMWVTRTES